MATNVILRWLIFMELMNQGNFYLVKILFPLRVGRGVPSFRANLRTWYEPTNGYTVLRTPKVLNLYKGFRNL